ncbi:MAG: hypothetical protein MUC95_08185, partial [Spirochaetes bacterium]|nr:hypothetical protein [Spirochaetota bacterium]
MTASPEMKKRVLSFFIIKKNKSALFAALIYFIMTSPLTAAMPLTDTIYTIPEGGIEIKSSAEFIKMNSDYNRETFSLGMGVLKDFSLWYSFQYLRRGTIKMEADELGDSFLRLWYFAGEFFNGSLRAGFQANFRIPTGADTYSSPEWRNLAFGNNELKLGPVFQLDIIKNIFLHLNVFYIFRQGQDEGFYGGISADLFDKKTYADLFGLNFQSEDAFLAKDKLKNDYAAVSLALNTDMLYPLIAYVELYKSQKVYNKKSGRDLQIEGAGINPLLLSAGCRYFFREPLFLGFFYITSPARNENYIKDQQDLHIKLYI